MVAFRFFEFAQVSIVRPCGASELLVVDVFENIKIQKLVVDVFENIKIPKIRYVCLVMFVIGYWKC